MGVWKDYFRDLKHLTASSSGAAVLECHARTYARRHAARREIRAANRRVTGLLDELGSFSTRWFDAHAADWLRLIETEGWAARPLDVLEIGSWEGRSTLFLAQHLPLARITAVDTWEGSDEHAGGAALQSLEERFERNVARFRERISKRRQSSLAYFAEQRPEDAFDLVYVDGSHFVDEVFLDALLAFKALRQGGVLIFDDYIWSFYARLRDNPAFAINEFLRFKRGSYQILSVTTQLVLRRTAPAGSAHA